ncbi:MAG: ArsR/SmtB family transcription factor [Steroidobacteraceae bacterium]
MAKSHAHAAQLRQVLRLFSLFGRPVRVIIFQRLARTPGTAGELARALPISRTAVVQHLKLLEAARLVDAFFQGKRRVYFVRREGLEPLVRWLRERCARSSR